MISAMDILRWDNGGVKVFISSVITGFEPYREAAAGAVRLLGHEVIRAEDFPALAASPQQACLAGVRRSDVVMLLGERYGQRQASGKAATEEEFGEAAASKPLLVFSQIGVDRDLDMVAFRRTGAELGRRQPHGPVLNAR